MDTLTGSAALNALTLPEQTAEVRLLAALEELRIADAIFQTLEPVMVTDGHAHILRVNQAFIENTGYRADEVIGRTPKMLRSGHHDTAFYAAMTDSIEGTGQWQGEIWDRRKNGEVFPKWMTITAVKDDQDKVTNFVAVYTDISERKQAEDRINQLAFYDVLTGLPNRALMQDRLQLAIAVNQGTGHYGALLLIDLDHFKTINDILGHNQGDVLLQQVGQRLAACIHDSDVAARIGGDEFVIILADLSSNQDQAARRTEAAAQQILKTLERDYRLNNADYPCSASIGITFFQGEQDHPESLLKQVELAMYQAKSDGRNRLRFFDVALEQALVERTQLERELRDGIAAGQLELYYQPQIAADAEDYRVIGSEALVRWNHPQRGLLGPGQFIPLAEETGLILPLGAWVMETACQQLAVWARKPDMAGLSLAVNVSAPQFLQEDFAALVMATLARSGADPDQLKLELTESLLLGNADAAIATMNRLKACGLRFSLDDFGTGYSSLSYLKRLPLDQLKIDQSFVGDLETSINDAVIARSITALAHSLDLDVIAEGVETAAQRDFLMNLGCTHFQGYYFSRPLPAAAFEAYCQTRKGPSSQE